VHSLCREAAVDEIAGLVAIPLFNGEGWDPGELTLAGATNSQMPRVVSIGEFAGTCTGVDPALDGRGVVGGTLDAFCEQIVAGADATGDVLVILGATLITWAVVDGWPEVPGLWTVPHTGAGKSMVGGPSNAGGIFRDWASRVLRQPGELEVPDINDVPVWLPYIRGERVPHHDPNRTAVADGLRVTQGPASLWRGIHEATGFAIRHQLDLAGVTEGTNRIVLAGGGSRVHGWVQAIADATGVEVHLGASPHGGALGAAFTARMAAEPGVDLAAAATWASTSEIVRPDPMWADAVEGRYHRFRELVDSTGSGSGGVS
jgi:xylulokinase